MNLNDWSKITIMMFSLMGPVGAAGVWAVDQTYVRKSELTTTFLIKEIREIERDISRIKRKQNRGKALAYELDDMYALEAEVRDLKLQLENR